MAKSAQDFIRLLDEQGLIGESIVRQLRQQVEGAAEPIAAEKVAKVLVNKGMLTAFQAKNLLGRVGPMEVSQQTSVPDADELGLVPLDDVNEPAVAVPADELDLVPLDDAPPEPKPAPKAAKPSEPAAPPAPAGDAAGLEPPEDAGGLTPLGDEELADAGLSPLDDLTSDPLLTDAAATAGSALMPGKEPKQKVKFLRSQWESPLFLVGGGLLIVLIIVGVFVYFILTRGTADAEFNLAEEDYRSGAYTQAIAKYDRYLKRYAKDVNASKARVRIALCHFRRAAEDANDWENPLRVAQEKLPTVVDEPAFGETARSELSGLLPDIAEGFARQAKSQADTASAAKFVALYEEAMKLVENPAFLPTSNRVGIQSRLDSIAERVATVQRDINRDKKRIEAIGAIRAAAAAGKTADAYRVRAELLKEYPSLVRSSDLYEAVLEISVKQREQVRVVDQEMVAEKADHPNSAKARVTLVSRSGETASGLENQVIYVMASGAAYGLRAGTGQVLWRRFVGYQTSHPPKRISQAIGSDAILVDGIRNELVRVEAATGRMKWRLPVDEPFAEPIVLSRKIIVPLTTGQLLEVNPDDGRSTRRVTLPQPLQAAPGTDSQRPVLYVACEHSNLYVLSEDTLECEEVFYLGHAPGTVDVPPVASMGHVLVVENAGADYSRLHVVATDASGLSLRRAQEPIRLQGHVVVAPARVGRRVIIVTNLGAIYLFEVDRNNEAEPVSIVSKTLPTTSDPLIGYLLADAGQLWVGDTRLTRYQIQAARGTMSRKWVGDEGDTFVGPLQALGNVLFHLRRRKGLPGVSVSAVRIAAGQGDQQAGQRLWETHLGVPTAGEVVVGTGRRIHVVSGQGDGFSISDTVLKAGLTDQPEAVTKRPNTVFTARDQLGDGMWMLSSRMTPQRVLMLDTSGSSPKVQPLDLVVPADSLTTTPVVFDGGLLVPSRVGQVYLLDPRTGAARVLPFQPRLEAGASIDWIRPGVIPGAAAQFVIGDGRGKLYRVGIKSEPKPHLESVAQVDLDVRLAGELAAVSDTAYGISRTQGGDILVAFGLEDLAMGTEWDLGGRAVWGPKRLGSLVLVASDGSRLLCLEEGQKLRWSVELPYGPLAGNPQVRKDDILLASREGTVWRISSETGEELGHLNVGEPLGAGPVAFNETMVLVPGSDGTVHAMAIP